jgi:hypothetical protein
MTAKELNAALDIIEGVDRLNICSRKAGGRDQRAYSPGPVSAKLDVTENIP